ncbi:hypothetical protein ABZ568_39855 [Streptomyces olindensis]|uniref:Uncharacterized protein n=1 Tax=Streptomyces olindensis TaxID=358823 RepID=A0ABV2Y8B5_9ACTN
MEGTPESASFLSAKGAVDAVDALVEGFVTEQRAQSIAAEYPEVAESVVAWIREAACARHWPRVERLANLAAALQAPGLGETLREILDADVPELNNEDLVDILGQIRATDAAASLYRAAERSVQVDAPAYWLCQKVIASLSEIATREALGYVRNMTASRWPDVVRWHAAVELGAEEELGFDEGRMLE